MKPQTNVYDVARAVTFAIAGIVIVALLGVSWVAVSLAQNPVAFDVDGGLDCNAAADGNVQFDGREVNVQDLGKARIDTITGKPQVWFYPMTDGVPARWINVPDFEQAKLTHLDGRCQGNIAVKGQVPALLLISALGIEPGKLESELRD